MSDTVKDITNLLSRFERTNGITIIVPFILMLHRSEPWRRQAIPYWLEFFPGDEPDEAAINRPNPARFPEHQTTQEWQCLPQIELRYHVFTHAARCPRIPGGEIAVAKVRGGCLWTMLPRSPTSNP